MTGRRLVVLLVVLAVIAIPAGVLRALCVGRSCDEPEPAAAIPFCPLPDRLKDLLVNGYREGRSPEVLGVTSGTPLFTEIGGGRAPWPGPTADTRVPIAFAGTGVQPGGIVPDVATLDRIAPTVAEAIGLDRPHPEVRSGTAFDGVATGDRPELVLLVTWKWTGTPDLEASPDRWPFLTTLLEDGAGTLEGDTGSLPLDPAATLSTIGTGGLPSQHGVTASVVRNDGGDVVPAYGEGAPIPVIASLADDLDQANGQRADVSLVATDELDRGLIGVGWAYEDADEDAVEIARGRDAVEAARSLLGRATLGDGIPDVLGVVLDGGIGVMDRSTEEIVRAARRAAGGSVLVVVAGTGTWASSRIAESDADLVAAIEAAVPGADPVVAATVPGGVFLDQSTLREAEVTGQVAVDALHGVTGPGGERMMADAFQGFAVSFARYC